MSKITVHLVNWDIIKIISSRELEQQELKVVLHDKVYADCFYKDYHYIKPFHVYYFSLDKKLVLGAPYHLSINSSLLTIDVSPTSLLPDFDSIYAYQGNDLGNSYTNEEVKFALWAPHAVKVFLEYKYKNMSQLVEMFRTNKGVWRISLPRVDEDIYYKYHAFIHDEEVITCDPYSRFGYNNCEYSVASPREFNINLNIDKLQPMNRIESVIYETNIRDFTIHRGSNIKHKGQFLGLTEENRITKGRHPAGLDYLKYLGVTTVQLQPIFDIATIDEKNPSASYNWGYDPEHYFILEGSYSSNIKKPTQVAEDFMKMVAKLHENNLRLSIDVVYNHMYEPRTQTLEKLVPFYFFRREKYNKLQNHAGCGGDFASERYMGRKLIIDSLKYLVKDLGVDAIRFDLMGLIDINTMKKAYDECRKIRPDIHFYGEGWNMGGAPYDYSYCLTMEHAFDNPEIGFFNDRYRNIGKGHGDKPTQQDNGFLLGNQSYIHGFKYIYLGSATNTTYPALFAKPSQSINYLECHDNCALYDVIRASLKLTDEKEIMRYIDLCNAALLASFGIPFIHAGQEIGFSKNNEHNTYNSGDAYNNFDYELLDARFEHATYLKTLIAARKKVSVFKLDDAKQIKKLVSFIDSDKGIVVYIKGQELMTIVINPTSKETTIKFDEDKIVVSIEDFDNVLQSPSKEILASPCSTMFLK